MNTKNICLQQPGEGPIGLNLDCEGTRTLMLFFHFFNELAQGREVGHKVAVSKLISIWCWSLKAFIFPAPHELS